MMDGWMDEWINEKWELKTQARDWVLIDSKTNLQLNPLIVRQFGCWSSPTSSPLFSFSSSIFISPKFKSCFHEPQKRSLQFKSLLDVFIYISKKKKKERKIRLSSTVCSGVQLLYTIWWMNGHWWVGL